MMYAPWESRRFSQYCKKICAWTLEIQIELFYGEHGLDTDSSWISSVFLLFRIEVQKSRLIYLQKLATYGCGSVPCVPIK